MFVLKADMQSHQVWLPSGWASEMCYLVAMDSLPCSYRQRGHCECYTRVSAKSVLSQWAFESYPYEFVVHFDSFTLMERYFKARELLYIMERLQSACPTASTNNISSVV